MPSTTWAAAPSICRILRLTRGVFEVMATGGDSALGGDDYDRALADWVLATSRSSLHVADLPAGKRAHPASRSPRASKKPCRPTPRMVRR